MILIVVLFGLANQTGKVCCILLAICCLLMLTASQLNAYNVSSNWKRFTKKKVPLELVLSWITHASTWEKNYSNVCVVIRVLQIKPPPIIWDKFIVYALVQRITSTIAGFIKNISKACLSAVLFDQCHTVRKKKAMQQSQRRNCHFHFCKSALFTYVSFSR